MQTIELTDRMVNALITVFPMFKMLIANVEDFFKSPQLHLKPSPWELLKRSLRRVTLPGPGSTRHPPSYDTDARHACSLRVLPSDIYTLNFEGPSGAL
jgi:hypothetical protein